VGLPERAFGSMELLSDDLIGQSGRFIGKRRRRGSPAGRDRIAWCELPGLVEIAQVEHVLVSVELKRETGPRPQAVESLPFRMEWATQL
jgi:hypothetical protein